MRTRTALVGLLAAATAAGAAVPALAATPKNFTKSYSFSDPTPDPTGNANDSDADHCDGQLPKEKPVVIAIPGPGYVDVQLSATGDWSMQLLDAKGAVLTGTDVNPPELEALSWRLKKAAKVQVFPCNLTGLPDAKFTVKYTYRK